MSSWLKLFMKRPLFPHPMTYLSYFWDRHKMQLMQPSQCWNESDKCCHQLQPATKTKCIILQYHSELAFPIGWYWWWIQFSGYDSSHINDTYLILSIFRPDGIVMGTFTSFAQAIIVLKLFAPKPKSGMCMILSYRTINKRAIYEVFVKHTSLNEIWWCDIKWCKRSNLMHWHNTQNENIWFFK